MNIKLLNLAAIALLLGLTACNKEETPTQEQIPSNAVQITASVGNPFTRSNPLGTVEEQAKFKDGDVILVRKYRAGTSFPRAFYTLVSDQWVLDSQMYPHLLWVNNVETFYAHYPPDPNNRPKDEVLVDQSTLGKLSHSDLMSDTIVDAPRGQILNFVMKRQTSRLIVNITKFNEEFPTGSKVADVKIVNQNHREPQTNPPTQYTNYAPYAVGDGSVGSTYTLLVGGEGMYYQYISLKVGEKEMRTAVLPTMEKGKSYTFNLVVGKEKLEIESVTVADWTGTVTLPDDRAGEFFLV